MTKKDKLEPSAHMFSTLDQLSAYVQSSLQDYPCSDNDKFFADNLSQHIDALIGDTRKDLDNLIECINRSE